MNYCWSFRVSVSWIFFSVWLFIGCGGSSIDPFSILSQPIDLAVSRTKVDFDRRERRLMFVLDRGTGAIGAIDEIRERLIDMDVHDHLKQSFIPIGPKPIGLDVYDQVDGVRLFVAEESGRQLFVVDVKGPQDPTTFGLQYTFQDVGSDVVSAVNRPIFENRGRRSSPVMSDLMITDQQTPCETWSARFVGSNNYEVRGSVAGIQANFARENERFEATSGEVSFTISSGRDRTTQDDRFWFIGCKSKPMMLEGRPIDVKVYKDQVAVVTSEPSEIVLLNAVSLDLVDRIAIPSVSSQMAKTSLSQGKLYIPDLANSSVVIWDWEANSFNIVSLPGPIAGVAIDAELSNQMLVFFREPSIGFWNLDTDLLTQRTRLAGYPRGFSGYILGGSILGLISLDSGQLEVIDLEKQTRLDVRGRDPEARAINVRFVDQEPYSDPQLLSIVANTEFVFNENWQVIFESYLPGNFELSASITDNQLIAASGLFITNRLKAGDVVEINGPGQVSEERTVLEIVDETTLIMDRSPSVQGTVTINVRLSGQYLMVGSVSGVQNNRVVENQPYQSDTGAISLIIRASLGNPVSRGDYFTFETIDGIATISSLSQRLAGASVVLTRPGDQTPTAYVVQSATGVISVINLSRRTVRRLIR